MRALPFMHLTREEKLAIYSYFDGDGSLAEKAKAACGSVTRGNWQRGF